MVSDEEIDVIAKRLKAKRERVHDLSGVGWVDDQDCQLAANALLAMKAERAELRKPTQSIDAEICDLALKIAVTFFFGADIEKMSSLQQTTIDEVKDRVLDGYIRIAGPYHERMRRAEAALSTALAEALEAAKQWILDYAKFAQDSGNREVYHHSTMIAKAIDALKDKQP